MTQVSEIAKRAAEKIAADLDLRNRSPHACMGWACALCNHSFDAALIQEAINEATKEAVGALRGMVREFGFDRVHPGMVHDERMAIHAAMDVLARYEGGSKLPSPQNDTAPVGAGWPQRRMF